ncbi:retrovirus-related pol polyprotein from transposon TNT 1-94 [Tanacetum coccineum]
MDQDRQMLMVDDTVRNQFRENAVQNVGHLVGQNAIQNQAARAEGNNNEINGNQIRCYNCRGESHYVSNCTVMLRKRDAAYLQQQLQIAQEEEAEIQSTQEEFDFMAAAGACEETERTNANYTLENNFAASIDICVEQSGGTTEQHPATVEETRTYQESLFHNLFAEVEKVNSVNRKIKETNVELTTELARYKNQEKCFEISQEEYDKLESCYQRSLQVDRKQIADLTTGACLDVIKIKKSVLKLGQENYDKLKCVIQKSAISRANVVSKGRDERQMSTIIIGVSV